MAQPQTHVAGRELVVSISDTKTGTFAKVYGITDYSLGELGDSETVDIVTPDGAQGLAGLPGPGECDFTVANALRHLGVWDDIIDGQAKALPLWWRITEKNSRNPVAEGGTGFTAAMTASDATVTFAGTGKKDIRDLFAPGMVFERMVGAGMPFRHRIDELTDADDMEVSPANGSSVWAASALWKVRHPSLERTFEAHAIGHNLVQSFGGALSGTIRVKATERIPKPVLIAA